MLPGGFVNKRVGREGVWLPGAGTEEDREKGKKKAAPTRLMRLPYLPERPCAYLAGPSRPSPLRSAPLPRAPAIIPRISRRKSC